MLKILNDKETDFSLEGITLMAIMLEMVYAAEIIAWQMADALDSKNVEKTVFQEKKHALTEARKACKRMLDQLTIAFDPTFDKIFTRVPGQTVRRTEAIQWGANDVIRLLCCYFSRADGDFEKRKRIQKAIMNFKPDEGLEDMDLNGMLDFFHINIDWK